MNTLSPTCSLGIRMIAPGATKTFRPVKPSISPRRWSSGPLSAQFAKRVNSKNSRSGICRFCIASKSSAPLGFAFEASDNLEGGFIFCAVAILIFATCDLTCLLLIKNDIKPKAKQENQPKQKPDHQPKPKPEGAAPEQENKPATEKPNQGKRPGKRPNYHHRHKPKSGGGQQNQG